MKFPVSRFAVEIAVPVSMMIAKLREIGAPVEHAESKVDEKVGRRAQDLIREEVRNKLLKEPVGTVVRDRGGRLVRAYYRGDPPSDLTKFILDSYVVHRSETDKRPTPPADYYNGEVRTAREISARWADALLAGMSFEEIGRWFEVELETSLRPSDAIKLWQAGIHPSDIGWSYADGGYGTLAQRLGSQVIDVDEVIGQVEYRRQQRGAS